MAIFITKFKRIRTFNPLLVYLVIFFSCFLVNLPTFFRYYVESDEEATRSLIKSIKTSTFFGRCGLGVLYSNVPFSLFNILVRDLLTTVLEIVFSLAALRYFIKFQSKKARLNPSRAQATENSRDNNKKKQKAKEESGLTIMTLYLSLISIITHLCLCMLYVALTLALDIFFVNYLIMFGGLTVTAKHFSNFFVIFSFNIKFRETLLGLIKRPSIRNNVIVI